MSPRNFPINPKLNKKISLIKNYLYFYELKYFITVYSSFNRCSMVSLKLEAEMSGAAGGIEATTLVDLNLFAPFLCIGFTSFFETVELFRSMCSRAGCFRSLSDAGFMIDGDVCEKSS